MIYLLDTSALLAHVRAEPGAERVQELFEREDAVLLLCSVSLVELARRLRDIGASPDEAWNKIAAYQQAVDEVVPIDEVVARLSDQLGMAATDRLPLVDALIAAATRSRDAVLVHRDPHFRALPSDALGQLDLGLA